MKNSIFIALMFIVPCACYAVCLDGYQTGIVVKVLDQDVSAQSGAKPVGAQQSAEQNNGATTLRTIIFSGRGNRYQLQLPAGIGGAYTLSNNDQLCFKVESKKVLVATVDGKQFPVSAKVLPKLPRK